MNDDGAMDDALPPSPPPFTDSPPRPPRPPPLQRILSDVSSSTAPTMSRQTVSHFFHLFSVFFSQSGSDGRPTIDEIMEADDEEGHCQVQNNVKENLFLVEEDALLTLLSHRCCDNASPRLNTLTRSLVGSALILRWRCSGCGGDNEWHSQQRIGQGRSTYFR